MAKMTRSEAQKKLNEIQDEIVKYQKKQLEKMIKLADEYDLTFYYRGSSDDYSGRYYGGPLSMKDDHMEENWLSEGWHSSACY